MKKCKIVMTTMFKNEASVVKRMLESCYKYIDYWVVQDNGSTDGTDKIVKDFFEEKGIPGHYYQVDEGWQGFGWNRDHLIKTCQSIEHGCDWILKMDCDETLKVEDDFDWSLLDDKTQHAFHIAALQDSCLYYRAWMWNAKMPWRFNHDTCHETIYCEIDGIGENFDRFNLPTSFMQLGTNEGQSWSVQTKFISDALILEEKLIREDTMLDDAYHFFYIGKSYSDTYRGDFFPLKESHQREYARRSVYYLTEFVNRIQAGEQTNKELSYMSLIFIGEAQAFLGEEQKAIETYNTCQDFCPERNDHLYRLAQMYEATKEYTKMLSAATIMMRPERVCPFPRYNLFIDTSVYVDGGSRVKEMYDRAISLVRSTTTSDQPEPTPLRINGGREKRIFIVDNFYSDPDKVREFAMNQEFKQEEKWYKGVRTTQAYRPSAIKEEFERIIGEKINNWHEHSMNGVFQITTAQDMQVYHHDEQKWAAMIYLTPEAPYDSGTRLHVSKINGANHCDQGEALMDEAFSGGFYDSSKFDIVADAKNVYNRLVIMDARHIHSAGSYFGNDLQTGRLTHLFFFD